MSFSRKQARKSRPRAKGIEKRISRPCPWCGRAGRVCWVMPCLELQNAVETKDDARVKSWAEHVGVGLERDGVRL